MLMKDKNNTLVKLKTTKNNIKKLLAVLPYEDYGKINSVRSFMNMFGYSKNEAHEVLLNNYNYIIDEQIKESNNGTKNDKKNVPKNDKKKNDKKNDKKNNKFLNDPMNPKMSYSITDKPTKFRKALKALNGLFSEIVYKVKNESDQINKTLLEDILIHEITNLFINKPNDKRLNVSVIIRYLKEKDDKTRPLGYSGLYSENIKSKNGVITYVNKYLELFNAYIEDHNDGESGYRWKGIQAVHIQSSLTNIPKTGSYIELCDFIKNKKCCVNIKNEDDKCLKWCIHASRHYDDVKKQNYKNLVNGYQKYEDANEIIEPKEISYPINIDKDLPKFEKLNNIKINVFEIENKKPVTIYNNYNNRDCETIIDLLLIRSDEKEHFVWIKNFDRFMRPANNFKHTYHHCRYCLNACYQKVEDLNKHIENCRKYEAVRCVLPTEKNNKMRFKNVCNTFKHPFYIVADFESTLIPYHDDPNNNTVKYQEHKANSYGLKFECIYSEYNKPIIIKNCENEEELMKSFVEECENLTQYAYSLTQLNKNFNQSWTKDESKKHYSALTCEMCNGNFESKNKKVIHHDHINGQYLATICNKCNLQLQYKRFIPIYLHNLKGYDSHFIVPNLSKYGQNCDDVGCIPNNEEKYISFNKKIVVDSYGEDEKSLHYEMRFLDTIAFMADSLSNLADNLKKDCKTIEDKRNAFKSLSSHYVDDEQFEMMCEKGVYPYDYITDYKVLSETKLPTIDKFYSKLTNEKCDEKDYKKAINVWKKFNCKTMLDYHNLYLVSDVLLLSDIWANFKNVCYKIYGLDSSYYYTAPSLSWDSMMKYCTENNEDFYIELITDMDIYLLFEKSIRGGLSQISKRYAKANNEYMPNYDKNAIDEYILYLDANNLYGAGMSSFLPYKNFKFNNEEWTKEKILKIEDDSKIGYLFECDLHYSKDLHDLHNGYALLSENKIITNDMLNESQRIDRKESKISKLITSFQDKIKYGINYRYLKLCLELGIEITKIHRVVEYEQSDFMKGYIMKNTNERMKSKNSFEKDFYKLMNNSVYGKTMENVRNRINFQLVTTESKALNMRNRKRAFTIFNENCVGVHLLKKEVVLNKPIFIGQNVLDESKVVMYNFHYNFMMKEFKRENIDLLFTDTDSLCYHIKNQNPYEIISKNKSLFDLSEYPKDHKDYDESNKKVIGKFKDEAIGGKFDCITEFVGLRSKLYAYKTLNKESKKCKGVKKYVVKQDFTFEKYNNIRINNNMEYINEHGTIKQNCIRSYQHKLFTETITKIGLNSKDDKSYLLDDNVTNITFGHYKYFNLA